MLALGIAAAITASLLYNASIALQALEAREVPQEHGLRPSLLGRLLRNRRWLGATALGLAGWPFEIAALLLAPLTVVQPCLAAGLVLLLWLGVTRLGERPGRQELLAVGAIVAGIAGVAAVAPDRSTAHAGTASIAVALAVVGLPLLAPYVLRRPLTRDTRRLGLLATVAAGCGYAWTAIAGKLLTDELSSGAVVAGALWLATLAVSESLALLSEMSALQRRPATQVAPMMFAIQILVPVLLAPLIFDESWAKTPLNGAVLLAFVALALAGTVLLSRSKAVAAVMESAHAED